MSDFTPTGYCGHVEDEHMTDPASGGLGQCDVEGCDCICFDLDSEDEDDDDE